tara:strand:- start:629 stop:1717 length:1089 start_codon:yes stop_codon:yes gene_type:complete
MPRPAELRQPDYEEKFDFSTLFFDCFRVDDHYIEFLGPPLANFFSHFESGSITVLSDANDEKTLPLSSLKRRRGWCQDEVTLPADNTDKSVKLSLGELGTYTVPIGENLKCVFENRRVLLGMVKYDPISWIKEWASFYAAYHATDALLLYNNNSPHYSGAELLSTLKALNLFKTIVIIDWEFPYGPQAGTNGLWDSVYCKTGAFQHAFKRLLANANSVINADIDELIVHEQHVSLHELVESCPVGYMQFQGIWASKPPIPGEKTLPEQRHHRHYRYHGQIDKNTIQCPPKWAVVPKTCPMDSQWRTHDISNKTSAPALTEELRYRHFRDLNTGWKLSRNKPLLAYNEDKLLIAAYRKIGWLP